MSKYILEKNSDLWVNGIVGEDVDRVKENARDLYHDVGDVKFTNTEKTLEDALDELKEIRSLLTQNNLRNEEDENELEEFERDASMDDLLSEQELLRLGMITFFTSKQSYMSKLPLSTTGYFGGNTKGRSPRLQLSIKIGV